MSRRSLTAMSHSRSRSPRRVFPAGTLNVENEVLEVLAVSARLGEGDGRYTEITAEAMRMRSARNILAMAEVAHWQSFSRTPSLEPEPRPEVEDPRAIAPMPTSKAMATPKPPAKAKPRAQHSALAPRFHVVPRHIHQGNLVPGHWHQEGFMSCHCCARRGVLNANLSYHGS